MFLEKKRFSLFNSSNQMNGAPESNRVKLSANVAPSRNGFRLVKKTPTDKIANDLLTIYQ